RISAFVEPLLAAERRAGFIFIRQSANPNGISAQSSGLRGTSNPENGTSNLAATPKWVAALLACVQTLAKIACSASRRTSYAQVTIGCLHSLDLFDQRSPAFLTLVLDTPHFNR